MFPDPSSLRPPLSASTPGCETNTGSAYRTGYRSWIASVRSRQRSSRAAVMQHGHLRLKRADAPRYPRHCRPLAGTRDRCSLIPAWFHDRVRRARNRRLSRCRNRRHRAEHPHRRDSAGRLRSGRSGSEARLRRAQRPDRRQTRDYRRPNRFRRRVVLQNPRGHPNPAGHYSPRPRSGSSSILAGIIGRRCPTSRPRCRGTVLWQLRLIKKVTAMLRPKPSLTLPGNVLDQARSPRIRLFVMRSRSY